MSLFTKLLEICNGVASEFQAGRDAARKDHGNPEDWRWIEIPPEDNSLLEWKTPVAEEGEGSAPEGQSTPAEGTGQGQSVREEMMWMFDPEQAFEVYKNFWLNVWQSYFHRTHY